MDRKEIVDRFLEKGLLLDPQALDVAIEMPPELLEKSITDLMSRGVDVVLAGDLKPAPKEVPKIPVAKIEVEIVPTQSGSDSRVDYLKHFQNRYDRLASIIRKKEFFSDNQNIMVVKSGGGEDTTMVGMICDKATTREGHIVLIAEDGTGRIRVLAPKGTKVAKVASSLVLDEVVGLRGKYDKGKKIFVAREITFPDIEEQDSPLASERVYAAFLSDLHYGSPEFMEESFANFLEWLKGEYGTNELRELAAYTRYVVICGDLIGGGGNRLLEKYGSLAELFGRIPKEILILAIPGESDTAGILEPQVGFLDEAIKAFAGLPNFRHAGNPCMARLSSVRVLLYHGKSLEDWTSSLGKKETCEAIREMLVRRHLAPIYGSAVPLLPSSKDPFLIGDVPRILHVGHAHESCSSVYKGVLLLSTPSWRTSDKERNAGSIQLVDLSTLERQEINFALQ